MSIRSIFPPERGILSSWAPWCRCMEHCGWPGVLLLLAGCAHSPVGESWRLAAADQPSFEEISAEPEAFTGQKVILGGEVARAKFQPEVAEIEIRQKRLDSGDRPKENLEPSPGRFLIRCIGALDPAHYFQGRPITVAGEIQGEVVREAEIRPLGRFHYVYPATRYPVVDCAEIHVWPMRWKVPDAYVPPYGPGLRGWRPYGYGYPYHHQPYWPYLPPR